MILLDTSVLSRVFRRTRPGPAEAGLRTVVESLMVGDADLGLPGIVLQEVLSGIRSEKQFSDLQHRLVMAFTIVQSTTADHIEAARLRNRCLSRGVNASGADCLVAALAIAGRHQLFAVDDDFDAIAKHAPLRMYRGR